MSGTPGSEALRGFSEETELPLAEGAAEKALTQTPLITRKRNLAAGELTWLVVVVA